MTASDSSTLWQISAPGAPGGGGIIWSVRYKANEKKALKKYRKLAGCNGEDISAQMMVCPVDGCWEFATELLASGELSDIVPNKLWVVSEVELRPGDKLCVNTVCPMCAKHARRFRRSIRERIFRLEERMDTLQKSLKEMEYEQWA